MVKVVESCVIKPAKETPIELMSLSQLDRVASITHPPVVYFYKPPIQFDSAVISLKDSLAKVLVEFYPLAGRLREIQEGRFEIDCNSFGADFLVAESELSVKDFGDFVPCEKLGHLVPKVDPKLPVCEQPLLLVQLTKLSCGGVCLGTAISHIVVDGSSAMHFMIEWARFAREGGTEFTGNPPFLDRTVVGGDGKCISSSFDHPEYSPKPLLVGRSDATEERMKDSVSVALKLERHDVDKIKQNANDNISDGVRPYSSFEAVAGHMWRCACKARRNLNHQMTRMYFPIDVRNRLEPRLPKYYFGNGVCRIAATSTCEKLLLQPLSHASSKIRETIDTVTNEYIRSAMHWVENLNDLNQHRITHSARSTDGAFFGNPNLATNSWASISIQGIDFGWGKQIYIGPASIGGDGKSLMIPSSEDGSILIYVRLQVDHAEDFRKFFYDP
jgi:shikimate O-hydroxycinnamoyltransferase